MARRRLLTGLLLGVNLISGGNARADTPSDCADYNLPDHGLPNGYPFDVQRIVTLFRFHRQADAVRELDEARGTVRGPWRWRVPPDLRGEVASTLDKLRDCIATTTPPPLGRLAIQVLGHESLPRSRVRPRPGARVYVEGVALGRTGANGRLTARVPSGRVYLEAESPISEWNSTDMSLAPGEAKSIDIILSDGKEVSARTTLTLVEAVDDIVPVTSRSLTLRFVDGGRFAPVTRTEEIDAVDVHGNVRADLREHFVVRDGEIVATDPRRVFDVLAPFLEETITLRIQAMASADEMHYGRVAFRVGQSPLTVTLAGPPSNRELPVSHVEVGVSTLHGIAIQRVSDANGRLHVESFPHGTVALECVVQAGGKYYYGEAMLRHAAPRSVTLVLRHVDDVKRGVAALRRD